MCHKLTRYYTNILRGVRVTLFLTNCIRTARFSRCQNQSVTERLFLYAFPCPAPMDGNTGTPERSVVCSELNSLLYTTRYKNTTFF